MLGASPVAFQRDGNNFAPRFGAAFDLFGNSRTILRAGYGIFYDRVFGLIYDTLRQTPSWTSFSQQHDDHPLPLTGRSRTARNVTHRRSRSGLFRGCKVATPLRAELVRGIQHALSQNTLIEVDHTVSLGRKLVTGDIWNRDSGNPGVQSIFATTNQGKSDFLSLQASVLAALQPGPPVSSRLDWSHAIDNQGDPLVSSEQRCARLPACLRFAGRSR